MWFREKELSVGDQHAGGGSVGLGVEVKQQWWIVFTLLSVPSALLLSLLLFLPLSPLFSYSLCTDVIGLSLLHATNSSLYSTLLSVFLFSFFSAFFLLSDLSSCPLIPPFWLCDTYYVVFLLSLLPIPPFLFWASCFQFFSFSSFILLLCHLLFFIFL